MDPIPPDTPPKTTGAEMTRKKQGLKFSDKWEPNPNQAAINRERMNGPIGEPEIPDRVQRIAQKIKPEKPG